MPKGSPASLQEAISGGAERALRGLRNGYPSYLPQNRLPNFPFKVQSV